MTNLIGGHIDLMIDNIGNVHPHIKDGSLGCWQQQARSGRGTATIATIAEPTRLCLRQLVRGGRASQDADRRRRQLSRTIADTLKLPDVAKRFDDSPSRQSGARQRQQPPTSSAESDQWRDAIAAAGIKID